MSLARRCTQAASTKRALIVAGKRQAPATHLTGLLCAPLYPADASRLGQLVELGVIESIVNVYETFVLGNQDIVPGDLLTTGGIDYVIRGAAAWSRPGTAGHFMHLTVERILQ